MHRIFYRRILVFGMSVIVGGIDFNDLDSHNIAGLDMFAVGAMRGGEAMVRAR